MPAFLSFFYAMNNRNLVLNLLKLKDYHSCHQPNFWERQTDQKRTNE